MTEVRISSLCERPCAGIAETGEAPSDAGGMECSRRRKVHSLIDKVYDPANLAEAWKEGCCRDLCWNLFSAVSGRARILDQAARSIGSSASLCVNVCHPSTLRMAI